MLLFDFLNLIIYSQRIVVKFKKDLNLLIPDLNERIKSEIVKGLQKIIYNILGEKLENELHNTTFQEVGYIFRRFKSIYSKHK